MSEFLFWFLRPVAEFVGSIALIAGLFLLLFTALWILVGFEWVRIKFKKMRSK